MMDLVKLRRWLLPSPKYLAGQYCKKALDYLPCGNCNLAGRLSGWFCFSGGCGAPGWRNRNVL